MKESLRELKQSQGRNLEKIKALNGLQETRDKLRHTGKKQRPPIYSFFYTELRSERLSLGS